MQTADIVKVLKNRELQIREIQNRELQGLPVCRNISFTKSVFPTMRCNKKLLNRAKKYLGGFCFAIWLVRKVCKKSFLLVEKLGIL